VRTCLPGCLHASSGINKDRWACFMLWSIGLTTEHAAEHITPQHCGRYYPSFHEGGGGQLMQKLVPACSSTAGSKVLSPGTSSLRTDP
jgi:hypothetical protein